MNRVGWADGSARVQHSHPELPSARYQTGMSEHTRSRAVGKPSYVLVLYAVVPRAREVPRYQTNMPIYRDDISCTKDCLLILPAGEPKMAEQPKNPHLPGGIVSIGLPNNGSDQLAQLETHRVLEAIRNKTGLDPREVYRTSHKNQGEHTRQIAFRVDDEIHAEAEKRIKADDKYLNVTELARQAFILWLSVEAELAGDEPGPTAIKMARDQQKREMDTIDEIIRTARDDLELADGEIARGETRARLNTLMDHCKERGYDKRVNSIRKALSAVPPAGID